MITLDDITAQVNLGLAGIIEQRVKICLNEKPNKMKQETWEKMCKKVISLAYYPVVIKNTEEEL